jgi:hypothetical protein
MLCRYDSIIDITDPSQYPEFSRPSIRRSPPKILKIRFIKSSYESISAQIRRGQYDVVEELRKFTEHVAEPQD